MTAYASARDVHVRVWMDGITFTDGITFGQITPGSIITGLFVGFYVHGI